MKTPHKFIPVLCLLALGLAAPALRAEDEAPSPKKEQGEKGNSGEMMKEKLGLTDAQAEQLKANPRVASKSSFLEVSPSRATQLINRDWTFTLGDVTGAEVPSFNDQGWSHVGLPHSFSMPYFRSDHFYVGYGWYRKSLPLNAAEIAGRRVALEFEGVFQDAEVFVNGKSVGRHQGGYNGFAYDVTSAVNAGDNLIAVRVNNLWNPRLAPRAGEHVFSGGIYRED